MAAEIPSALRCPVWRCPAMWRNREQLLGHLGREHNGGEVLSALADSEVTLAAIKLPNGMQLSDVLTESRASAFIPPDETVP